MVKKKSVVLCSISINHIAILAHHRCCFTLFVGRQWWLSRKKLRAKCMWAFVGSMYVGGWMGASKFYSTWGASRTIAGKCAQKHVIQTFTHKPSTNLTHRCWSVGHITWWIGTLSHFICLAILVDSDSVAVLSPLPLATPLPPLLRMTHLD